MAYTMDLAIKKALVIFLDIMGLFLILLNFMAYDDVKCVESHPLAKITMPNKELYVANNDIVFSASQSTNSADCKNVSYSWIFEQSHERDGVETTHMFNSSGKYNIQLTVQDETRNSNAISNTIKIESENSVKLIVAKLYHFLNITSTIPDSLIQDNFINSSNNEISAHGKFQTDSPILFKTIEFVESHNATYRWEFTNSTVHTKESTVTHVFKNSGNHQVVVSLVTDQNVRKVGEMNIEINSKPTFLKENLLAIIGLVLNLPSVVLFVVSYQKSKKNKKKRGKS